MVPTLEFASRQQTRRSVRWKECCFAWGGTGWRAAARVVEIEETERMTARSGIASDWPGQRSCSIIVWYSNSSNGGQAWGG